MARQTPQQKRANAGYAKTIEKQMGRPQSAYKKKDTPKSPISMPMLSKSRSLECVMDRRQMAD